MMPAKKENHRIHISRTANEWDVIDKKAIESGSSNFNKYLNSKLFFLKNEYLKCQDCIADNIQKREKREFYVNPDLYKEIIRISDRAKIPISTIIDRLIIDKLILSM